MPSAEQKITPTRDEIVRASTWCAIVAAVFSLAHSYTGIRHDGIMYLAQALARLHPEIFHADVFFRWGSQDQYTLFSPLYSWLIVHLGLGHADVMLVLLSQGLFLAASFALVRVLVQPGLRGFAMVFIACSTGLYGGFFIFRFAEPFVTPRPYVEAATLLAVLLLVSGRRGGSIVVLAASALLHPLVALSGMLYWWLYHVIEDRRWCWLLVLGVVPAGAGLAGIAPFSQLFQSFDRQWLDILLLHNAHLFVTRWSYFDLGLLAFDLMALTMAIDMVKGKSKIALQAALAAAIASIGITLVGADLMHNVLITNLQIWRALWIVHWMALAALPIVVFRLWSENATGRLVAGLALFSFALRGQPAALAATVIAAILFNYRKRLAPRPGVAWIGICALALAGFVEWGSYAYRAYVHVFYDSVEPIADFIVLALSRPFPLLLFASAIAMIGLSQRRNPRPALLVAGCLLAFAAAVWDQRTPFNIYVESAALGSHPFSRIVKPGQSVLWYDSALAPWVLMQRESYISNSQYSGESFNRGTAIELLRRSKVIDILEFQERVCKLMNVLDNNYDACAPDLETVRDMCAEATDLDYLVLQTRIENKWLASWTPPVDVGGRRQYFYLYGCKSLAQN